MRGTFRSGRNIAAIVPGLFVVVGLFANGLSQVAISPEHYMKHVSFLASDALKGRGNGSPELERAAEYIASQFQASGLGPAGDNQSYFQKFDITVGAEFGPGSKLWIDGSEFRAQQDFAIMPVSSSGDYEGDIVFAGYGITAPDLGWDDYSGIDVTGKAVIVFRNLPKDKGPGSSFRDYAGIAGGFVSKVRSAKEHGARVILFVTSPNNPEDEAESIGSETNDLDPQDLGIIAAHIRRESIAPIFRAIGKDISDLQRTIDATSRPQSFEVMNSSIHVSSDLRRIKTTVRNVLAAIPGSDPTLKNEWIVIGAHYDHLGLGEKNIQFPREIGKIHHGADDNASGTAGLLELASLFERKKGRFDRSLLFVAFAGEELGMLGSNYFVDHPLKESMSIAAMFNLDMIGRLSGGPLNVMGIQTVPDLSERVRQANQDVGLTLAFSNGATEISDDLPFQTKRIPTLSFFSGQHRDYHTSSDTAEKIDVTGAIQTLSLVAGTIERIASGRAHFQYAEAQGNERQDSESGSLLTETYFGSIPTSRATKELVFERCEADSPAANAGLKAGDLLVEFAGFAIQSPGDFMNILQSLRPGDMASVLVRRNGKLVRITATLE